MKTLKGTNEFLDDSLEGIDLGDGLSLDDDFGDIDISLDDIGDLDSEWSTLEPVEVVIVDNGHQELSKILEGNRVYLKSSKSSPIVEDKKRVVKSIVQLIVGRLGECNESTDINKANSRIRDIVSRNVKDVMDNGIDMGSMRAKSIGEELTELGLSFKSRKDMKSLDDEIRMKLVSVGDKMDKAIKAMSAKEMKQTFQLPSYDYEERLIVEFSKIEYYVDEHKCVCSCGNCGERQDYTPVESIKTVSELDPRGNMFIFNPMLCESCGAVSILTDENRRKVNDLGYRKYEELERITLEGSASVTVDNTVLSILPMVEVDYGEAELDSMSVSKQGRVPVEATIESARKSIKTLHQQMYSGILMSKDQHSRRVELYIRNAFCKIAGNSDGEVWLPYCTGALLQSPSFNVIKQLCEQITAETSNQLEVDKLHKLVSVLVDSNSSGNEFELSSTCEGLLDSVKRLGVSIGRFKSITPKNVYKVCAKLEPVVNELRGEKHATVLALKDKLECLVEVFEEHTEYLRFLVPAYGDPSEYFKLFHNVDLAWRLIEVAKVNTAKHLWDVTMCDRSKFILSKRSGLKGLASSKMSDVVDTIDKAILANEHNQTYYNKFVVELPSSLRGLESSIQSMKYFRFIYSVLELKDTSLGESDICKMLESRIAKINVPVELRTLYSECNSIDQFEAICTLKLVGFAESDIRDYLEDNLFDCRKLVHWDGVSTIQEYKSTLNDGVPYIPTGCVLDLYEYSELILLLCTVMSARILRTRPELKSLNQSVIGACVDLVEHYFRTELGADLVGYCECFSFMDTSRYVPNPIVNDYPQIVFDLDRAEYFTEKATVGSVVFSKYIRDVSDELYSKDEYDENDFQDTKVLDSLLQELPDDAEYIPLLKLNKIFQTNENVMAVESICDLVPEDYRGLMRQYMSILDKSKYEDSCCDRTLALKYLPSFGKLVDVIGKRVGVNTNSAINALLDEAVIEEFRRC